jgi:hypothetical protein
MLSDQQIIELTATATVGEFFSEFGDRLPISTTAVRCPDSTGKS